MRRNSKKYLKLEYYRKKYGYKQSDFAVLLGMCTSAYSHKENGFSSITMDEAVKILSVLNKQASKAGDSPLTLNEIFLP